MCQEGLATVMSCPPGLAFNIGTSSCDWPSNVPDCVPDGEYSVNTIFFETFISKSKNIIDRFWSNNSNLITLTIFNSGLDF